MATLDTYGDEAAGELRVTRSLGRLDGAIATLTQAPEILAMLRRKEAVASSQLDGVQASLLNLLDAEAGLAAAGPARDVAELRALGEVMSRLPGKTVLDAPLAWLLRTHADLMQALGRKEAGWRRTQLWVGTAGATRAEARHVPPPAEQLPALLQEWEQSIAETADEGPLVKLSRGLAEFEAIHPFLECNGRMARLLLQQRLMRAGLLQHPVLLWSQQLQRRRHDVQQALRARNESGRWTRFFFTILAQAADETVDILGRVAALRERHRQQIVAQFGRTVPQALRLADALLANPVIGIKDVIEQTGLTFPAANDLVRRFEREGLLVEVTGNARNRRFRYAPYVRIFLDDE